MVKIIRIIGVAMFLLTVSSNVWAGVDGPTPTPKPTSRPSVSAPRAHSSPKGANYYHNDDYYARHPFAPTATQASPTIYTLHPSTPAPRPVPLAIPATQHGNSGGFSGGFYMRIVTCSLDGFVLDKNLQKTNEVCPKATTFTPAPKSTSQAPASNKAIPK